ncbi:MAG: aldehyde ferredoxin oxidoreductase family protein [Archaeoglobaceae archaeon]|nr:aldehyde ferredoxin oxidoreductase family protein [Archaeoglobaceae archaeon]
MFAYCGKILRVNLSDRTSSVLPLNEKDAKMFVGGAGIGARLHYQMRTYEKDPLSPENPMIIMSGPLTATPAPATSRLSFCARSPLTRIWGESSSGGKMGAYIKYAGWDGVIIEGRSDKPVYLKIDKNGVEFKDASGIWGKGCYETQEIIERELGEKRTATAVIGQAGENMVKYACIQVDNSRHAGRTGMGAVFGSKKLKGIAVCYDPAEKFEIKLANPDGFKEVVSQFVEAIKNDFVCTMFKDLGTSGYVENAEAFGDLPVKYYSKGTFEGATNISGSAMARSILRGNDGCLGCIVRCGRVVEHKGKKIHGPEYETVSAFGSLQLNDDLESIVEINHLCNDLGMDTISAGVTIAFAMWMTEKGIGKFNIKWGDAKRVKEVVKDIAFRKGIGGELAEGVRFLEEKYNVRGWGAHVKGLEIPMHDARAFASLACAYAVHVRGACHLTHQMYLYEMGRVIEEYEIISNDRFANDGKGILTAKVQNFSEFFNAVTMCAFMPLTPTMLVKMLNFATGFGYDLNSLAKTGERMLTLKRLYNLKCGVKPEHDTLPQVVLQPLEGGSAGNVPDVKKQVQEYYNYRKWINGIPSEEKLKELELV